MYSRCLREDKPCAEIQLGWKAQDRTKYLLSNRDGNVVYFWHYTKSAAGSHHMHRSIHRPQYHSLPLGKKKWSISVWKELSFIFIQLNHSSKSRKGSHPSLPLKIIFWMKSWLHFHIKRSLMETISPLPPPEIFLRLYELNFYCLLTSPIFKDHRSSSQIITLTFCSLRSQQKRNFSPILKFQYQACCNRHSQDNQASPAHTEHKEQSHRPFTSCVTFCPCQVTASLVQV